MFYLVLFFGGFPFPTLLIKLTLLSLVLLLSPLTVFTLLTLPILYCLNSFGEKRLFCLYNV